MRERAILGYEHFLLRRQLQKQPVHSQARQRNEVLMPRDTSQVIHRAPNLCECRRRQGPTLLQRRGHLVALLVAMRPSLISLHRDVGDWLRRYKR